MSSSESGTASQEDDIYLSEDDHATDTCSICLTYEQEGRLNWSESNVAASAMVHQACSECDAFKVDESQLCDFCIHIRPAHLMTCRRVLDLFEEGEYFSFNDPKYEVLIGTPLELKSRVGSCAFCQWCLEVVQADVQLSQSVIDEGEAIRIERIIHMETYGVPPFDLKWEARTYLISKAKTSQAAADGGGGGNGSYASYVSIGHNKELPSFFDNFEDEILLYSRHDISLLTSVADWAAVRQWRSRCEQEHETCDERAVGKMPDHFRLIDVAKKCIIDADKNPPPFFALSYVWGANSENEMALSQNNLGEMQQPGSLHNLPRTIADAMHVCERLDQDFLWVDRLCIVQDNKEDKYGQIRSLEAIYSRADLVIVAACGENMQSELAGVNEESSREQYQFSIDVFGFTMANKIQYFDSALQCKWNERGWTYQEAVLARRKLYFTPTELWFECAEGLERENQISGISFRKRRGNHLTAYGSRNVNSSSDVFEEYGHHVEQYTGRVMTYPSDIYHAFHGIENAFYPECQFIFGLPEFDFNRALLWQSRYRQKLEERQCSDRDIVLPSWSWASLIGKVQVGTLFGSSPECKVRDEGSFYCSLCSWATLGGKDQQTLVPIVSIHDGNVWASLDRLWLGNALFGKHPTHRQFLALAWVKGCIEAEVPTDLFRSGFDPGRLQPNSIISAQDLKSRWPTIQDFWADVRDRQHHGKDHPQPIGLDKGHILTRTQSSTMNVEFRSEQSEDRTQETFLIRHTRTWGTDDKIVGWISSKAEYELRGTATSEGCADVNFIALAIGYMPRYETRLLDKEALRKNCFNQSYSEFLLRKDQPGFRLRKDQPGFLFTEDQPGVIVMAVRWSGPVARRIGLGWVTLQGWVDSKPEFRTVILA